MFKKLECTAEIMCRVPFQMSTSTGITAFDLDCTKVWRYNHAYVSDCPGSRVRRER